LATNSIRGGANRKVLERIKATGDVFWAQSDRDWILEGAAVRVSMVGFDSAEETSRTLDDQAVLAINSNLAASIDLTRAHRLAENANLSFMGVTPAGSFDIPEATARAWMDLLVNPNGRPNSDVLRPYFNGMDLTRRPRGVWIIDFGVGTALEQASLYEAPFEHLVTYVKPERAANNRQAYREKWWLFAESRPAMRAALSSLKRYIGTSMVSKHFQFSWIPSKVLPANLVIVVAREDDYFFGVLHSKPHKLWSLRMGTSLEDRPRYTPTTTFETFPFPWPPGQEPLDDARVEAIAAAARELVRLRDAWLNPPDASEAELKKRTLTNLYNARPTWLDNAHRKLDAAVFAAYGWPTDLSDEAILERLLALNLERARQS
jgi:type II restriction/modification system DNA methylase subunit YeeA